MQAAFRTGVPKTLRAVIVATVALLVFLALTPAAGAQSKEPKAVPTECESVVLQLKWSHQFQFAGYYAAVERGFYREEGLDVKLIEKFPGQDYVEEVVAGGAHYGVGESFEILNHRLHGTPVVALAVIFQHSPTILLAREDSGIASPQDMIGKRVALGQGIESGLYEAVLLSEGISLNQITRLEHSHDVEDLIQGKADVVVAYMTNWPYIIENAGVPVNVIHPLTYGFDWYGDCLFTSENELREHPERVRAFREASLRGWEYAMAHPDELIDVILAKYNRNIERDVLLYEAETMRELMVPALIEIGHMNPERWRDMAETYAKLGIAEPDYSLDGFIYDPNPKPYFTYVRWLVGVTISLALLVGLWATTLLIFNHRLKSAVEHQTAELSKLNKALVREVSERKRSEEALLQSEERLTITLNSIGEAVIATDTKGRITLVNPVAARLTGWPQEEAAKASLDEVLRLINSETRETLENPVTSVLREGKMIGAVDHTTLVSKDGAERQIALSGAPILNKEGKSVGVVLVFRDVTEQDKLEKQLRQSQKLESVGQLAGGIAHDFNNLLSGILGYAEILVDHLDGNARLQGYSQAILDTALRAADLTKQLLAFSRKGKKQSVHVDVHKLIAEVISILQRTIDPRIVINQRLEALPSVTKGDPSQLESALLNLAVNARDAIPKGGEIVFTTATVTLDRDFCAASPYDIEPGRYVELAVMDTGVGMDGQTLERIFEPFFTTKEVGKGTGLGLAAVFGTVREHRGAISVYSQPKQGSVFKIYLPLAGEKESVVSEEETEVVLDGSGCILVVDDEELIRSMTRDMLRGMGYEVLWAADGEEGFHVYKENAGYIDLIILDLVMPNVNGRQALRALKKLNPNVKVLITTGFNVGIDFDELRELGANGFIQKPFRRIELARAIADVLAGRQPRGL